MYLRCIGKDDQLREQKTNFGGREYINGGPAYLIFCRKYQSLWGIVFAELSLIKKL